MTADLVSLVILVLLALVVDAAYGTLDPVDQVLINVSEKLSGFKDTIYVCRVGDPKREPPEHLAGPCKSKHPNGRKPVYVDFDQGVIRLDTTFGVDERFVEPGSENAIYLHRIAEVVRDEAERLRDSEKGFRAAQLKKWKLSEIVVEGHADHNIVSKEEKTRPRPPPEEYTNRELLAYAKKEFGKNKKLPDEGKGREAILNWIREMHLKDIAYDDNVKLAMFRARGFAEMLSGVSGAPVLVASYGCHRPMGRLPEADRGKAKTDLSCFAKNKDDAYPLIFLEPQEVDPKKAVSDTALNRRIEVRFNFRMGASTND